MPFQFADRRQISWMLVLSISLGIALSFGFQPTVNQLTQAFSKVCMGPHWCLFSNEVIWFGLAFLFLISLPNKNLSSPYTVQPNRLVWMGILPLIISFVFGALKTTSPIDFRKTLWYWALGPIVEEFIFRGWTLSFLNRIFKGKYLAFPPPLPMAIWGQALVFSIWHLQNWEALPFPVLVLQLFYTFMVGIWLGFYRWQTGHLWPSCLAHSLLNFSADWKFWLVL